MRDQQHADELEIRRESQELAVAWRRGRAAFVLDTLEAAEPLRAALLATLIHGSLDRWAAYDSKWPDGFRHALLLRSRGCITGYELAELEREYSRKFGSGPPLQQTERSADPARRARITAQQVRRVRDALASGQPIVRERPITASTLFLRPQPAGR